MHAVSDSGAEPEAGAVLEAGAALEVIYGPGTGRSIAIGSEGVILGRGPEAALAFSGDTRMSHRHALLHRAKDGGYTVTDLGSTNGTRINGAPIQGPAAVTRGDVISVGETRLRMSDSPEPVTARQPYPVTRETAVPEPSPDPWAHWAEQSYRGHPRLIQAAADAARAAMAQGASADQAASAAQAAANAAATADARNAWADWARRSCADDPGLIQAATDAAMAAIGRGAGTDQAASAAQAAVAAAIRPAAAAVGQGPAASRQQAPPAPSGAPGSLYGQVIGFQQRYEAYGRRQVQVWYFQLYRRDSDPASLPALAVEMRGYGFTGAIRDGDEVEVTGHARPGEVICARQVRNLTSNSVVRARGQVEFGRAATVVTALVFLVAAALAVLLAINYYRGHA